EVQDGDRLRFIVTSTGVTPEYYQKRVDDFRASLKEGAQKLEPYIRDPKPRETAKLRLESQETQFATFYTTSYIFAGAPRSYAVDGRFLHLTGGEPSEAIVYRSYPPEAIDTASAVVALLEVAAVKYFRCLADTIEQSQLQAAAAPAEFPALLPLAREHSELSRRREQAMAEGADLAKPSRYWTEADEKQFRSVYSRVRYHPAYRAVQERTGRLGAYLGCPKRDEMR